MSDKRTLPGPGLAEAVRIRRRIGRHVLFGAIAFVAVVAGLGGMAATIELAGAVVAEGRLVVSSSVKKVAHTVGGSVAEIAVHDGDHVRAGQLLLRLDGTLASANLAIIEKSLAELAVRRVRLEAERDGAATLAFPPRILARSGEPAVREQMAIETAQFSSRLAAREGQKNQLGKKIAELQHQAAGIAAQRAAVVRQAELTRQELAGLQALAAKTLVPRDRLSAVGRQAAQYDGQLGGLDADAGQIGAEIAQTELQILQVDEDMRSEVAKQLSEDESKSNEMSERLIAARDQLQKLDLRAPQDGIVYQLGVHTAGAVVAPGETILQIVPADDVLVVEAHVAPGEVDRIHIGAEADLRFTSLGARTTPQFMGQVLSVSPDVVIDERTGTGFFVARVALPADALASLGPALVPGMPVEVFIATGERTALAYLAKPLADQIQHAFRER